MRRSCAARLVAHGTVGEVGEPQRGQSRRLRVDVEIGEHVAHQRLIDELGTEGAAVVGVVRGGRSAVAHDRGRGGRAIETGHVDHLDDRAHATSGFADEPADGLVVLDLAAGVGVVAELVLQALQGDVVARAVRAGSAARRSTKAPRAVAPKPVAGPEFGAEVNHLCPVIRKLPSAWATAVVVLARTSEPPCFSVIDMPAMSPRLAVGTVSSGW